MSKIKNDSVIRALLRQPTPHTPIWIMRQAGRYLPEYNQTRARAGSFLSLCRNPDLATEVTLQPLARFPLDAAILFSDILTIPDAMGLGLYFKEEGGPCFERPLRDEREVRNLIVPEPEEHLEYVLNAVAQIHRALDQEIPLIGFSGSPFTLACYMVEGGGRCDFVQLKTMLYQRPDLLHHILEKNAQAVIKYLNAQIQHGVDIVMLFDTWGGILSPAAYQEFSLRYIKRVLAGLTKRRGVSQIPSIVFTKGGGLWLEDIAECGCDAVGIDWMTDLTIARRQIGDKVALQGNLDPTVLLSSKQVIRDEVTKVLACFGKGTGHVFNLGHGILPHTPPDNVAALVDAVHELSIPYH